MTRSRDRRLAAAFDGVASTYGRGPGNASMALLKARARRRLLDRVPRGGLVCDAACGPGSDAAVFAAAGRRIEALDVSPGMCATARRRLARWIARDRARVTCARFQDAPARLTGRCDAVWSHWGTSFEPSLAPFARFCARVLRPGGAAVFTVVGRWSIWEVASGLARGQLGAAFRRRRPGGVGLVFGGRTVTAWAPPLSRALSPFHGDFTVERIEPLGLFIPPPSFSRPGRRWAVPVWRALATLEPWARPLVRLADQALVIVTRR